MKCEEHDLYSAIFEAPRMSIFAGITIVGKNDHENAAMLS
jgi:hypothetical protein